jgi:hypothetical protein
MYSRLASATSISRILLTSLMMALPRASCAQRSPTTRLETPQNRMAVDTYVDEHLVLVVRLLLLVAHLGDGLALLLIAVVGQLGAQAVDRFRRQHALDVAPAASRMMSKHNSHSGRSSYERFSAETSLPWSTNACEIRFSKERRQNQQQEQTCSAARKSASGSVHG